MTASPIREGDFVWCAFPERENPARPGPQHLCYILAISGSDGTSPFSALCAYTTSQPWSGSAIPLGLILFDRQDAAELGQARAFVLDLRRLAFVPVTAPWFPQIDRPGSGVQGRAPKVLQRELWQTATELLSRRGEIVERLGPLWPGRTR